MKIHSVALFAAVLAVPLAASADARLRVPPGAFQNSEIRGALARLDHTTGDFKGELNKALDNSILNGTSLEDRLNGWANLLEDEMDAANKEFARAANAGDRPDVDAMERFADHWGNAMMAATAINRAMIRRGFAPRPEQQWTGIRADLDTISADLGRPPLPDMAVVIFRPASPRTMMRPDVKAVMRDLRASSDRFQDRLEHAWFVAMGPSERHVLERWSDDLKSATGRLIDEYNDNDAAEFQFKLEECLMLGAGLNRAMLVSPAAAGPVLEWQDLRSRLNTLAARFGYPALPESLHT